MQKIMTLCFVFDGNKVLLGLKKTGFGKGRWNGFGGKVEDGEKIEDAAVREMEEECGVRPLDFEKRGILTFAYAHNDATFEVHVFVAHRYEGTPEEREKLIPKWFEVSDVLYERMWPDDKYWWPLFLTGKKFTGRFMFKDYDTILEYEVKEVDSLAEVASVAV